MMAMLPSCPAVCCVIRTAVATRIGFGLERSKKCTHFSSTAVNRNGNWLARPPASRACNPILKFKSIIIITKIA